MTDPEVQAGWRVKLAFALFVISLIMPVFLPIVAALKLSPTLTATMSGGLLAFAEVLLIIAAAVAGKSGFAYIKSRVFGFLKQYGPPQEVSRSRYTIGLVLFILPLTYGWLGPYIEAALKLEVDWVVYAVGDIAFIVSLFVLGGDFWDKLRGLFIHGAKIMLPEKPLSAPIPE